MLAACSGGADSVALVLALAELLRDGFLSAVAVGHVHHGLRPGEADADLEVARRLAGSLGLPFHERRVDAAAASARRRRGMEEAARHVRHEALEALRVETRSDAIALAHSADDQAETVLLRLLRGSGAEGLGAMSSRRGAIARPLLGMRRRELRAIAHAAGITWASDPTNWSPASARALIRELLDRLQDSLDEGIVPRLCETAEQLRAESSWLDERAAELLLPRLRHEAGPEGLPMARVRDADALGAAPAVLRRRAVRRLLRELRPGEPPPSADAVRRAMRLFDPPPRPGAALLAGLALRRAGHDVVAGAERPWRAPGEPVVVREGSPLRWAGGVLVLGEPGSGDAGTAVRLDAGLLTGGLAVRCRRPGDAIGEGAGRRRIARLMGDAGLPPPWRDAHPVVCLGPDAATIVWLAGIRADPRFLAQASSTRVVELRWIPPESATGATE